MNEISRTADQGAVERCTGCGEIVAATLMLPALCNGEEIVECLFCLAEKKLISI